MESLGKSRLYRASLIEEIEEGLVVARQSLAVQSSFHSREVVESIKSGSSNIIKCFASHEGKKIRPPSMTDTRFTHLCNFYPERRVENNVKLRTRESPRKMIINKLRNEPCKSCSWSFGNARKCPTSLRRDALIKRSPHKTM